MNILALIAQAVGDSGSGLSISAQQPQSFSGSLSAAPALCLGSACV